MLNLGYQRKLGDVAETSPDSPCAYLETEEISDTEPAVFTDGFDNEAGASASPQPAPLSDALNDLFNQLNSEISDNEPAAFTPYFDNEAGASASSQRAPLSDTLSGDLFTQLNSEICDIEPAVFSHGLDNEAGVMKDSSKQWESPPADHSYPSVRLPRTVRTVSYRTLNSDDILFYSGITVPVFDKLVSALKTLDKTVRKILTLEDQLLWTLMRLRLGLLCGDLARRFEVSVAYVSKTFSIVLNHLVKVMERSRCVIAPLKTAGKHA
ncbi:hypothetical protein MTO96_004606 [Rhipicephalus appendiculatus]